MARFRPALWSRDRARVAPLGDARAVGVGLGRWTVVAVHPGHMGAVPVVLSPWIAVVAVTSSVLVGVLSGVVPARRASRLDPVDALRYE